MAPTAGPQPAPTYDESLIERRMVWLLALSSTYAAAVLIANVMSIRAVSLFGWAVDAGTLIYPLTFTLRDLIHKVGGKRAARAAVLVTVALTGLMVLAFIAAAALPADIAVGAQEEFGQVLNGAWRIVVASLIAQLVSEMADTEIYERFTRRFGNRAQYGRVLASNAVSVPLDSVLFAVIAFADTFPGSVVWEIIVANIVIKGVSSLVTAPLIYTVPGMSKLEALGPGAHRVPAAG